MITKCVEGQYRYDHEMLRYTITRWQNDFFNSLLFRMLSARRMFKNCAWNGLCISMKGKTIDGILALG